MAKSAKKKPGKTVKKPSAKGKSSSKAKKISSLKIKASRRKAPAKKIVAKKISAKKEARKKSSAKEVLEKIPAKRVFSTPASRKHEAMALPKTAPQLNIFPVLTQRPIAHKSINSFAMPDDKTRYSDEELREFEILIQGKLAKAREEFHILKETLNRNNDAGTDATSGGNTKVLEDGAETAEKENLSQLAARQLKFITNLENALVRIKNRTYGICTVTGKLIPKERLIAVPHTTQSIEAKMMKQD